MERKMDGSKSRPRQYSPKLKKMQKTKCKRTSKGPQHPSITNMINQDKDCACEIMARAVAHDVHKNLGISEARDAINSGQYTSAIHFESETSRLMYPNLPK